jgi:hypothetical protein
MLTASRADQPSAENLLNKLLPSPEVQPVTTADIFSLCSFIADM